LTTLNDIISFNKEDSKDKSMSQKSKSKSKSVLNMNLDSEVISVNDFELIANKNKLKKKSEEVSVSKFTKSSRKSKKSHIEKSESQTKHSIISKSITHKSNATSSDFSTYNEKHERYFKRKLESENKNYKIYTQKIDLLNKLNNLYKKGYWDNYRKMSVNNLYDDIKEEYSKKKKEANSKGMLEGLRFGLIILIYSLEYSISYVDDNQKGWTESSYYNIMNGDYDEALLEIAEIYFGSDEQWRPELRIIFGITLSGISYNLFNRFTSKNTSQNSSFTNILSGIFNSTMNNNNNNNNNNLGPLMNLFNSINKNQTPTQSNYDQSNYDQYNQPQNYGQYYDQQYNQQYEGDGGSESKIKIPDTDFNDSEIDNIINKMHKNENPNPTNINQQKQTEKLKIINEPQAPKRKYRKKKIEV
jgi:hypothetical protein